jgi:DNA topoisomerase-2
MENRIETQNNETLNTYADFINKEYAYFAIMRNKRSIPSLFNGLIPGQRKVLLTCFKLNQIKKITVH